MPVIQFTKATKKRAKARVALDGPAGSGKTYTALELAVALAQGGKIAGVDTEHGSMSLYSDKFDFDVIELDDFHPQNYIDAIHAAEDGGYSVMILDSLSHAWDGKGGVLELHDDATARDRNGNSYTAWRNVTPIHNDLVEAIVTSPIHIIATMRSKMEYAQEKDDNGKTKIRKIGMAPIQRAGTEYEFTMVGDMDVDHKIVISKSRCDIMADKVGTKPGLKFWMPFVDWLNSGDAVAELTPEERKAEAEKKFAEAQAAAAAEAAAIAEAQKAANAKKARAEGWNNLCTELVKAGYYKDAASVKATVKSRSGWTYSVEGHEQMKADLIALAQTIDAAVKEMESTNAAETIQPAEGTENPAGAGTPELP
jgi:hypothetical protein